MTVCQEIAKRVSGWKMYPDLGSKDGKSDIDIDALTPLGFKFVGIHYPVSYTHLDVYKRQALYRPYGSNRQRDWPVYCADQGGCPGTRQTGGRSEGYRPVPGDAEEARMLRK